MLNYIALCLVAYGSFTVFTFCASNIILPYCYALPRLTKLQRSGVIGEFPLTKIVVPPIIWTTIVAIIILLVADYLPELLTAVAIGLGAAIIVTFWQIISNNPKLEEDFNDSYLSKLTPKTITDPEHLALSSRTLGSILATIYKNDYPEADLLNPETTYIGGSPIYTYLYLLDLWLIMDRNTGLRRVLPTFTPYSMRSKFLLLVSMRSYAEKDQEILANISPKNHQEAIMAILDFEFGQKNPTDKKGKQWKTLRNHFIEHDIPKIDAAYMLYRHTDNLDPTKPPQ